jgi:threonine/homoserine/homoserine lactone efflux protein
MGWELAHGAWSGKLALDFEARGEPTRLARLGSVPAGALISLSNPYWFLWWATIGAGYVVVALEFGIVGLAAFYVGHILADLTWNSLLTFVASSGRKILPAAFYKWLLITFGIFLIGFSIYFLLTGIAFLQS